MVAAWAAAAYDPLIDEALAPRRGPALSLGVHRLQNDFGVHGGLSSPWLLDGHLSFRLEGGVAWFEDLRALPPDGDPDTFGALELYGTARALLVAATPIGLASGRLYVAVGPSLLFIDDRLSSDTVSPGVYGVAGVELFAGDAYRSSPFSFFFEAGGVAHTATADVENRIGAPETTDSFVARAIATGFALGAGLRFHLW
ncbi:MAG: hypothetical protein AAGD10_13535 [Myxococcota bacterium]